MKALFDTNVLLAAFLSNGVCYELYIETHDKCAVFHTAFVLHEFSRTLKTKFHFHEDRINELVSFVKSTSRAGITGETTVTVCRDINDNQILSDALANDIDVIVTGDKDLLILKSYETAKILSPAQFLLLMKQLS